MVTMETYSLASLGQQKATTAATTTTTTTTATKWSRGGGTCQDVVVCGYPFQGVPATNIRAELLAATKALEKCLQILEFFAPCQILLLTDSAYVLQVLEGGRSGLHMCLCKLVLSCCGIDVRTKWWLGTFMPTRGTH